MSLLIILKYQISDGTWTKVTSQRFSVKSEAKWWLKEQIYEGNLEDGHYYLASCVLAGELKKRLLGKGSKNGSKR